MINCFFKIGQMIGGQLMPSQIFNPAMMQSDPLMMQAQMGGNIMMGQMPMGGGFLQQGGLPPINFAEQLSSLLSAQGYDSNQQAMLQAQQQMPQLLTNTGVPTPVLWQNPTAVDYQSALLGLRDNPMQYLDFGQGQPVF